MAFDYRTGYDPEAQANASLQQLGSSEMLKFLLNYNSQFKDMPGVATALSQRGFNPQDPMTEINATSGMYHFSQVKRNLEAMSPQTQIGQWDRMDEVSRNTLTAMGYNLNASPEQIQQYMKAEQRSHEDWRWGFFGNIRHAIAKALHPLGWGAGELLKPITVPTNYITDRAMSWYNATLLGINVNRGHGADIVSPEGNYHFSSISMADAYNFVNDRKNKRWIVNPWTIHTDLSPEMQQLVQHMAVGTPDDVLVKQYGEGAFEEALTSPSAQKYLHAVMGAQNSGGRQLARTLGIQPGTKPFTVISGTADFAPTFVANMYLANLPLAAGGQALKGSIFAEKLAANGEAVLNAYNKSSTFRTAVHALNAARDDQGRLDFHKIRNLFPNPRELPDEVINDIVTKKPNTPEEMRDVFAYYADGPALGRGESAATGLLPIPHMNVLGVLKANYKLKAEEYLDKLSTLHADQYEGMGINDAALGPIRAGARAVRGVMNLGVPLSVERNDLVMADPKLLTYVDRLLHVGVMAPQLREDLMNRFAASDLPGRMKMLEGIYQTSVDAVVRMYGKTVAGIPSLKEYMDILKERLDKAINVSGEVADETGAAVNTVDDGLSKLRGPVTVKQSAEALKMPVPAMKEIVAGVKSVNLLHHAVHYHQLFDLTDAAMENAWKPAHLIKLGFPMRIALEEGLREMFSRGLLSVPEGFMAKLYAHAKLKGEATGLRLSERSGQGRFRDLIAAHVHAATEKMEGALLPHEVRDYVDAKVQNHGWRLAQPSVDARRLEPFERTSAYDRALEQGHDLTDEPTFRGPKEYDDRVGDDRFIGLANGLNDFDSPEVHAAMNKVAEHAAVHAMTPGRFDLAAMKRDVAKEVRKWYDTTAAQEPLRHHWGLKMTSSRARVADKGTVAQAGQLSYDDALDQLSSRVAGGMAGLIVDKKGRPIHQIIQYVTENHKMPDSLWLSKNVLVDSLPTKFARRKLEYKARGWETTVNFSFRHMENMINSWSREPLSLFEGAKAWKQLDALDWEDLTRKLGADGARRYRLEMADNMASRQLEGMIHDPDTRSLFAQMHKTMIPFQFAHEQFLKRWGKTLFENPEAIARAQLLMHGLRSMGIVTKDGHGGENFQYPMTGFMQTELTKVANTLGIKAFMPQGINFSSNVNHLIPSLDKPLMPGLGPYVTVPMTGFGRHNKTMHDLNEFIMGKVPAEESWWGQFAPAVVKQIINAYAVSPEHANSSQLSAIIESANWLQANPATRLDENATYKDKQEWRDRAIRMGRHVLVYRALFGFASPGTPDLTYTKSLAPEWQRLIRSKNDFGAAAQAFHAAHPDADMYQVFPTKPTVSGLGPPRPESKEVGDWIKKNQGFVKKYGGAAATFFLPMKAGPYDPETAMLERANNIRENRSLIDPIHGDGMWEQSQVNADAPYYYAMEHQFQKAAAGLHGAAKQAANAWWASKKEEYLSTRPIFREYVENSATRGAERQLTFDRVEKALSDPSRPRTPSADALAQVVNAYNGLQGILKQMRGARSFQAMGAKTQLIDFFRTWGESQDDPQARAFFHAIIAPTLGVA